MYSRGELKSVSKLEEHGLQEQKTTSGSPPVNQEQESETKGAQCERVRGAFPIFSAPVSY